MRKSNIKIIVISLFSLFILSCERGELLNSEADIIEVILPDSLKVGTPVITNTQIRIRKEAFTPQDSTALADRLKNLSLTFALTPGATISPDNNTALDYLTHSNTFTVTSEDREWSKTYEVSFFDSKFDRTEFNFSNRMLVDEKYYAFFEIDDRTNEKQFVWDSGNKGFTIAASNKPAEDYPTAATPNGYIGYGVKLVTRSTGSAGAIFGMPIAAGNLFLGQFDFNKAILKPLEATQFGVSTVMPEPKELTLWCKYKAGPEYKDKAGNTLNVIDHPDIFAVLYEPKTDENGKPVLLNGTNIKTADNIISIAVMSEEQYEQIRVDDVDTGEYQQITIPFEQKKTFDSDKQHKGMYYIALVFSSSAKGDLFEGAVGSTFCVDEVKFVN